MIIHYNCTIGSFLLHLLLLIYHPYPPSFHEMIFILVPLVEAILERQGAPKIRTYITYARALGQTAPLLSRPRDKAMASFRRECWPLVDLYLGVLTGKYKDSVGQKAHRLSVRNRFT